MEPNNFIDSIALALLVFAISSMIISMFLSSSIVVFDSKSVESLINLLSSGCYVIGLSVFVLKLKT